MNFITDYQLDIDKGFRCKVNEHVFDMRFMKSGDGISWFLTDQFRKLLIKLGLNPDVVVKPYGEFVNNKLCYCDSKQQCYDLCQSIVNAYFRPAEIARDIISFRCDNKSYKFELKLLSEKYVWKNTTDPLKYIVNKSSINIKKVKEELNIKLYEMPNSGCLGFDSREDALKFAKWVKENFYDKQEGCEKSRRYLAKYYNDSRVSICNHTFILTAISSGVYWQLDEMKCSSLLYTQFSLTDKDVEEICKSLNIHITWYLAILSFSNTHDAIKFTDYLIETYIIKKEKTYDTNQLRKERATINRGAKPAGSIIYGRRGKASIRRGCIKYQTCIGY